MLPVIKIRIASPFLPGRFAGVPECFELFLVAKRVHRLPEAFVIVDRELLVPSQALHRFAFPYRRVAVDIVGDFRAEHEKPAVDPATVADWLLAKAENAGAVCFDSPETSWRLRRGDSRQSTLALVQGDHRLEVDVGKAIAIGQAKSRIAST